MSSFRTFIICICAVLIFAMPCYARNENHADKQHDNKYRICGVQDENDMFGGGTDQHYTHGARLSCVSGAHTVPPWLEDFSNHIPVFDDGGDWRWSFALGHNLYTPSDITIPTLIVDERPYAAWLYSSAALMSDSKTHIDTAEFSLGIVGPAALGEDVQSWVHKNISDSPAPRGWDHQLNNEITLMATYERMWRVLQTKGESGLMFDLLPFAGANLGNVFTDIGAGATARFGFGLQTDYGPPRIRPSTPGSDFFIPADNWAGYVFLGGSGRLVGYNMFLDGNMFSNSHSVDKHTLVGDIQTGLALSYKRVRLSFTKIFRTEEYEKQKSPDEFGSLNLSVAFPLGAE